MASISQRSDGTRRLLVVLPTGRRKELRLGHMPAKSAVSLKTWIERLISCRRRGADIDPQTATWLAEVDDDTHATLARWELCEPRRRVEAVTVADWCRRYIDNRADLKRSSRVSIEQGRQRLVDHFGPNKRLADVTEGDAEDFRQALLRAGLADNTVRRTIGKARQFWRAAIRRRLVAVNPFEGLSASVKSNDARRFYVDRPTAAKVLAQITDADIRLAFVLARFAGFRVPSELVGLTWGDVPVGQRSDACTQP